MKLSTNQRIQKIVEKLEQEQYVQSKDLAEEFGVSMETIRKDLMFLESRNIATKTYGGASLSTLEVEKGLDFRSHHQDYKREIGKEIANMLTDCHRIFLDNGTTILASAEFINTLPTLDIVTTSIPLFEQLNGNIHNVFLTGGRKREKNQALIGNWAERYLQSVHCDICILGTAGILDCDGPTTHSYQEVSSKQIMIQNSERIYVACDHTKFQEHGFHTICTWDDIDAVITDSHISTKQLKAIEDKVDVQVAKE